MEALDFPEMVADRYHVHNVEIVYPHFASSEPSYISEFQNRLKKAHSRLVNVPVDYEELWEKPALSSPDAKQREHAISLYRKGIDLAAALGSPTARCDPGTVNLDDPSVTIGSYKTLVAYGKSKGVGIVVENHGAISRHPEVLARILLASGAGALPDIGNFPDEETRERGLRLMYPLATGISHAKLGPGFDLAKCLQIAKGAGFKGVFSIEALGRGDSYEAVQQILDALNRLLEQE
jgi:sugar phosphate isomerase/epimerase